MADIPGTNRKALSVVIVSMPCHIQPLDAKIAEDMPGSFGKNFLMFCDTADIREGDRITRITDESGDDETEYRVVGIEKYDFIGSRHMEVSIRTFS